MFCLTPQERKIIFLIAGLILLGGILRFFNPAGMDKDSFQNSEVAAASGSNQKKISININQAGQAELELLPGVGSVTANRIIEYRSNYGSFKSREELKKVKGIGEQKAEALAGFITF